MANTYGNVYIQTVFAVKYRAAVIQKSWQSELHCVIGNLINETGCQSLIVNGVEDHIHCLFTLKPSINISDVMKSSKSKSSKWINEQGFLEHRFSWQVGFGAFSYSRSQVAAVYQYIANQEQRHQHQSFRDEYIELLQKFEVDFEEKYIFADLE